MKGATLLLRLGGAPVRVRIEGSERLARSFAAYYAGVVPSSGKPHVLLRWNEDRGEVRWRGYLTARSGDPGMLCAWAEWAAAGEAIRRVRSRGLLLHASWAAKGRVSALFAGGHGLGKTTLAAALALRHGWRILADDMVLLRDRGTPLALERPVRIKPGGRPALREIRAGTYSLSRFGGSLNRPPVSAIILLGAPGGRLRSGRLDEGMAVARLGGLALNFADTPRRALSTLARLARRVPIYEIRGGGLEARCREARRLLPK